ncbi:MAG: radical SAM protein [Candidatus Bathyarchaeia archaeon]|nr:radical SAM protein [Candidatus Bathyarchaeota archaeon A05DMB-4]MDH7594722.1 radical SAM protein [Candidatus Bathyarchaeota archaeon]
MQLPRFNSFAQGFCTCSPKYNLNTYLGRCGHNCIYCYATKFPSFNGSPAPRIKLLEHIEAMAASTKQKLPVMISDCTDPYQPLESDYQITRKCVEVLVRHGFPLLMVTKSDLVTRDVDLFRKTSTVVSVTITTPNEDTAKKIEPNAPTPEKRINALQKIVAKGVSATARIDPIIPYVNDDPKEFETLVRMLSEVGVKQVTVATVKPVKGFFTKVQQLFPEKYEKIVKAYEDGEWIVGYRYLAAEKKRTIIHKLRSVVLGHGLEFAACREGFPEYNTIMCDGTAYCRNTLTKYMKDQAH